MPARRALHVACLSAATLLVTGCGGGSGGEAGPQPPTVMIQSVAPASPWATLPVTFVAFGSSPQGGALTFAWAFGDGATGTGASVQHAYAAAGNYTVSLTATAADGLTTRTTAVVIVAMPTPTGLVIDINASIAYVDEGLSFTGSATDPAGLPLTYAWDFGDTTTGTGDWTIHPWSAPGTYTVKVTATNTLARSAEKTTTITVLPVPPAVAVADDALVPWCAGPLCAARDGGAYSGPGLAIWRYHNSTALPAQPVVRLAGLTAGRQVTLVLSNGNRDAVSVAGPWQGSRTVPAPPGSPELAAPSEPADPREEAHAAMALRNHEAARRIAALPRTERSGAAASIGPATLRATPVVGDTRSWTDTFTSPAVAYATRVHATCAVPGGRNVVFWIDPTVLGAGKVTEEMLLLLEAKFCGATGGVARTVALLGDVWGPAASSIAGILHESPGALLDVNVAILGVSPATPWGGYVDPDNARLKGAAAPNSNEALVFMVNGADLPNSPEYYVSLLVHELTHMVNVYQRSVVLGAVNDVWLEEMSAMMSEDVVAPALNETYSTLLGRVLSYAQTGAGLGLESWPVNVVSFPHYGMGGAFGAFLNRRYGLSVYRGITAGCTTPSTISDGHACLDGLIRLAGGLGYADDFDRLGASVFSRLPGELLPWGFGFPERFAGGYDLWQLPVAILPGPLPVAPAIDPTFPATSQVFVEDTVAAGATTYTRTGVTVPPGTSLLVVVR